MDIKDIEKQVKASLKMLVDQGQVNDDIKITAIMDTEDEKLAREILEEEDQDIRVQIEYKIPRPVEYINITLNVDKDDD